VEEKNMEKKLGPILAVGAKVFIRTVTHYYTGLVVSITNEAVLLTDAAWIAGKLNEVEPFPAGVEVRQAAIIDVSPWLHPLPREVK
jgi:hypothetical protein